MKCAPHQPEGSLVIYAGIYAKTWHVADAGTMLPQHAHTWPHLTLLMRGAIRLWRGDDLDGDYHAPATLKIPAQELHAFLTLTDNVVLACVHNADHVDGDTPEIHARHDLELED